MMSTMHQDMTGYAAASVPRYTSYPTAPHFDGAVDGTVYGDWLSSLPAGESLSLYLHVPFCRSICHYCGCHTKAARRDEPIRTYAAMLRREIELVLRHLGSRRQLVHVHWGGGTPSILSEGDFLGLVDQIREGFRCAEDMEHAIELDPRSVSERLAAMLRYAGVNRVNLGVQDFNPQVQLAIGRYQPFEQVLEAVSTLREEGLRRIGFDLMYGLPHQGERETVLNAARAAGMWPDRIAVFGYAHMPWLRKHQGRIDSAALPDAGERIEQERVIGTVLQSAGYARIGLDHFALRHDPLATAASAGLLRRNFQGYTADPADVLIGVGASAIGRLPQGYVQNAAQTAHWQRVVQRGELATVRGKQLSPEDRLRGAVIEQIMCSFEVDLDSVGADLRIEADHLAGWRSALAPLVGDGLVRIEGSRISVAPEYHAFVRHVAAAFDSYLNTGEGRHSMAV